MKVRVLASFSGQRPDGRPFTAQPKKVLEWPGGDEDALRIIAAGLAEPVDDIPAPKKAAVPKPEPKPAPAPDLFVASPNDDSVESYEIPPISPGARKLIAENGISDDELQEIEPTGKGGRIVNSDVLRYLKSKQ